MKIYKAREELDVQDANLARSRFDDVNLEQAMFTNVNFREAKFSDVNLTQVSIENANLSHMTIEGVLVSELFAAHRLMKESRTGTVLFAKNFDNHITNMATVEIKAFLPARDYELSKRFYTDLGFTAAWSSQDLAYFHAGKSSFLLSKFYQKEFAENLMMHLLVEDVEAWWQQVQARQLAVRYGVRVNPPENRPWGIRDFTIDDPTGVLWRIGQNMEVAEQSAQTDHT